MRDYTLINERRIKAYNLRQEGLKWREVGDRLGVSQSRAAQLARCGERAGWLKTIVIGALNEECNVAT